MPPETLKELHIDTIESLPTIKRVMFTTGRIEDFSCPANKTQAFLWDVKVPGLGLRATKTGAKAFVVERKLGRQTVRVTIGDPSDWPLETIWEGRGSDRVAKQQGARAEARRLLGLIDAGKDPRQEKAASIAKARAERDAIKAERMRHEVTGLDAWADYRKAKADRWGELSRRDHDQAVQKGGEPRKRSLAKTTQPGPLYRLLARPLARLDSSVVADWLKADAKLRPTVTAKSFRLLRAFVNWCAEHETYALIVVPNACAAKRTRELVPKPRAKKDALEREQLGVWFLEVRRQGNPVVAAYLQALLLTGARREELLSLRWSDVDFQWCRMELKDKVMGRRTIPLTPFVSEVLASLPRPERNPWVFASSSSKNGRLQEPRLGHNKALAAGGLRHVTLHGLRRSFGSLSEWIEAPVGIVAQIQGHKPTALIEKHYRVRPLDILRMWHTKLEAWILDQAGIDFVSAPSGRAPLRLAKAA